MEDERLLTEVEVAALLRLKVATLQSWRRQPGVGPVFCRLGGKERGAVRYPRDEVRRYVETSKITVGRGTAAETPSIIAALKG